MLQTRRVLGLCCLVFSAVACSGEDGDDPGGGTAASSGTGAVAGSNTGGGGASGGTAGSAGAVSGGASGSAGSAGTVGETGGTAGAGAGAGGTAGSAGSGGTAGEGSLACSETDRGCLCFPGPEGADDVPFCDPLAVNGMCCEDPLLGSCSCRMWSCENDSLGCSCGSSVDGPLTACNGVYGVCCLSVIGTASNCYCDDLLTECVGDNDMEVANCDIEIAPCGAGETEVDSCKP
jgi:hypothetical protein